MSLADAIARLEARAPSVAAPPASPASPAGWTAAQVVVHCAQSLECNVDGFPVLKPAWFRATLGRLVLAVFLWRGRLSHGLAEQIPGLPAPEDVPLPVAFARLHAAAARLAAAGSLAPHTFFGAMSPAQADAYHALHLEDHLRGWG